MSVIVICPPDASFDWRFSSNSSSLKIRILGFESHQICRRNLRNALKIFDPMHDKQGRILNPLFLQIVVLPCIRLISFAGSTTLVIAGLQESVPAIISAQDSRISYNDHQGLRASNGYVEPLEGKCRKPSGYRSFENQYVNQCHTVSKASEGGQVLTAHLAVLKEAETLARIVIEYTLRASDRTDDHDESFLPLEFLGGPDGDFIELMLLKELAQLQDLLPVGRNDADIAWLDALFGECFGVFLRNEDS